MAIRHSGNAVFSPTVRPRTGLLVGEVTPSIAIFRIVFSDGRPLPFSDVRTPPLPVFDAIPIFLEPLLLLTQILVVVDHNHGVLGWGRCATKTCIRRSAGPSDARRSNYEMVESIFHRFSSSNSAYDQ